MLPRRSGPVRKSSFRARALLAQGTLRAAKRAAENGQCAVAELLLAFSNFGAVGSGASSPRRVLKALDVGVSAADAAAAILACRARSSGDALGMGATRVPAEAKDI